MATTSQAGPTSTFSSGAEEVGQAVTSTSLINNSCGITNSSLSSQQNHHHSNSVNNNNGSNSTNNSRVPESGKRKKLKSRNTTVPDSNYSKNHLDAWLETCLKDATTAQLSSSSEFLDYNPSNLQSNKKSLSQQHQKQQQQQQKKHQMPTHQSVTSSNHNHHHHLPHHQRDNLQQFAMRLPPQSTTFGSHPAPFSQGFQKNVSMYMRNTFSNRFPTIHSNANNAFQCNDGATEFTSLPPIVNVMNSENDNNSTDVLDGSSNPNMSRGFRFSDPCLLNPSDNDSKMSGQNTPDCRNSGEEDNNKFFAALMEQINLLHETNSKICRNLHETKVDIEALKHAPNWGLRHRRDSLSGLSTHSQPLGFGFGTQSPAPTYHSGAYTPGMMTDVVREVKEAARVREDALLSRVKAMVEERSWSMGESNVRTMRDMEELKAQIHQLRVDRKESNKRISHLEAENKYMRQMLGTLLSNRPQNIIYENETTQRSMMSHRKNFQMHDNSCPTVRHKPKRSNSLNLHYGTVLHQAVSGEESGEQMNELYIMETTPNFIAPVTAAEVESIATSVVRTPTEMRNSFSSSDGGGGGQSVPTNPLTIMNGSISTPPAFALVSTPKEDNKRNEKLKDIDTEELRRELQEAVAARDKADSRIIALEKMVKKLQVKSSPTPNINGDERNLFSGISNIIMTDVSNETGCSGGGGSVGGNGGNSRTAPSNSNNSTSSSFLLHAPNTIPALQKLANIHSAHGSIALERTASPSHNYNEKMSSTSSSSTSATTPETTIHSQSFNNANQQQTHQQVTSPKMSLAGPITNL